MWRWFLYCCGKHCNPGVHCIFLCKWWNWLSQPFSRCLGLCVVCAAVACGLIFLSSSCKEVNVWFCLCENLDVCLTSTCHYSTLGLLSFAFLLWFWWFTHLWLWAQSLQRIQIIFFLVLFSAVNASEPLLWPVYVRAPCGAELKCLSCVALTLTGRKNQGWSWFIASHCKQHGKMP